MSVPALDASSVVEPIRRLAQEGGVLAVITRIDGPSYRRLGAMMAVLADGVRVGTLSSGCVEADIALHAEATLAEGKPKAITYGKGSPFADITLPCGGGLEVLLLPSPDSAVLEQVIAVHEARQTCTLSIEPASGDMSVQQGGESGFDGALFSIVIKPELAFYVFGKGPEAVTFAGLVHSAGYPSLLLSPDDETLNLAAAAGCAVRHLNSPMLPDDMQPDAHSAVVLFFHDHEWEPPIVAQALKSEAFYIGAQGSMRASALRRQELTLLGVSAADIARVKGPIGLIPSVRDARKLAVSVLAEVLSL
ncbi:XdhC family protein [Lentibacter algarum]|uniref:XdhC family protein n=1 Tax=Lentibacter algarum TaxID=576131 RepID=UPI001C076448|nr:XdhC family protein [Lentibacter algarum]MBU2980678.1 XdhC family protein [Lentibacter algarum]